MKNKYQMKWSNDKFTIFSAEVAYVQMLVSMEQK